jgi:siroheme synthase-like protein
MMNAVPLYPVSLRVAGTSCLIVGGGPVAGRKALGLLRCGANVVLVAPDPSGALEVLENAGLPAVADSMAKDKVLGGRSGSSVTPCALVVHRRPYLTGEAGGYWMVIAATGQPGIDEHVFRDARRAGVLVNTVDDPARCTVMLPSVHWDDPVTVSVSTGGSSPALASWMRDRVAAFLGSGWGQLATVLAEARCALHEQGRSTTEVDWEALFAGPLPFLTASGQLEEARQLLAEHLRSSISPTTPKLRYDP